MNNITLQVKSKTKIIVDCEQYNLDCTWTWNVAKFFVSVLLHSILYIAMHMIFILRLMPSINKYRDKVFDRVCCFGTLFIDNQMF